VDVELFLDEVLLFLLAQVFGLGVPFLALILTASVHLLGWFGLAEHGVFGDGVYAAVFAVCASSGASRVIRIMPGITEIRSSLFALLLEHALAFLHAPLFLPLCLRVVKFTVT